ncbi:MAG TPA: hypothetical protein VEL76_05165 [Gemmataceae bacterium]|nr:hypothetical protein [Gemmataceae bacterium]
MAAEGKRKKAKGKRKGGGFLSSFFLFPFSFFLLFQCGCFGVSQNPSYFPYLWPTGDIIQTHAKPPGPGYYANFDPHAVGLVVRPETATNPVRTQHVLIATVLDEKGQPRRHRRVEWMVEGVGNIIEVDESGLWPGRGYKVDNKYAVSYTDYCEHRITRGNANPNDDFVIRPGQSWCVISAAAEGDTHVTVYAPGVHNWEKGRVVVTCRWVDAAWKFPDPAVAQSGTEQLLTTRIFRHTDQQPLAGYRVRYRLLNDDPPALFLPRGPEPEAVAISDLNGNATARLVQAALRPGVNRIGIDVIRPPDPTAPSGTGIVIAHGETSVEWLAPAITMTHTAPPFAGVNQEVPFTISITNSGKIETRSMTVMNVVPDGLVYTRSDPPAVVNGPQLIWTLGRLPPGATHTINVAYRTTRLGPVTSRAEVVTEEGLKDTKDAVTQVTQPGLKVSISGPTGGIIGRPATFQVTLSNPGSGPATNIVVNAVFDDGLEHETKVPSMNLKGLPDLGPQERRDLPALTLTPRRNGRLKLRFEAKANGGLSDVAEHEIVVEEPRLKVSMTGPKTGYVSLPAEWEVSVSNPGKVPLTGVSLRDQLPPEVRFESSTEGGQPADNGVVWNLGALGPGEEKRVRVRGTCEKVAQEVVNRAVATAEAGPTVADQASLEIRGTPAFRFSVKDEGDPVLVGKRVLYRISVTNTGTLAANQVEVRAFLPPELKLVVPNGVKGPGQAVVKGQAIEFVPLDNIEPQQTLEYTIEAEGVKAGDARFRAELRSQALERPVVEEQSTRVIEPLPGTNGAAAPPAGEQLVPVPAISVRDLPARMPPGPAPPR